MKKIAVMSIPFFVVWMIVEGPIWLTVLLTVLAIGLMIGGEHDDSR